MFEVIGVEGLLDSPPSVAWGTAAIADEKSLIDPISKMRLPRERIEELRKEGHLTIIPKPIKIDDRYRHDPLILLLVSLDDPLAEIALPDPGRAGGLVAHQRWKAVAYYVFRNLETFDSYCKDALAKIISRILYASPSQSLQTQLMKLGFVIDSSNPYLNGLRVYFEKNNRDHVYEICKLNVKPEEFFLFETFLNACSQPDARYYIKYRGEVTTNGGLDIDVANRILQALNTIHSSVAQYLRSFYSFFEQLIPPPRFVEMKASSAELHFTTNVEGRPLGDRVARYLELLLLERVLRGESLPNTPSTPQLQAAVDKAIHVGPNTSVQHKPLGAKDPETISSARAIPASSTRRDVLSLLGFQIGLIDQAKKIEVQVFPRRALLVSTQDDTLDESQEGLDYLNKENDFLFQPAVFTFLRRSDFSLQQESFHLLRVDWIRVGERRLVTAIPSSILPGTFMIDVAVRLSRTTVDVIDTNNGDLSGFAEPTLGGAVLWMHQWSRLAYDLELRSAASESASWTSPVTTPKIGALNRVLVVLNALGGKATIVDLVEQINARFNAYVRVNNTRREVYRHPDLLEFAPEHDQYLQLTSLGKRHVEAYLRAGGPSSQD